MCDIQGWSYDINALSNGRISVFLLYLKDMPTGINSLFLICLELKKLSTRNSVFPQFDGGLFTFIPILSRLSLISLPNVCVPGIVLLPSVRPPAANSH